MKSFAKQKKLGGGSDGDVRERERVKGKERDKNDYIFYYSLCLCRYPSRSSQSKLEELHNIRKSSQK